VSNTIKIVAAVAAFVLFITAAVFAYNHLNQRGVAPDDNGSSQGEERLKAPDFTVFDADGRSVKFSEHLGEPVVLNFWASWCYPCRSEMPLLDEVYREYGAAINFMMVDLVDGRRETVEKGAAYIRKEGFTFPVYFDIDQEAAVNYAVGSIPMTLFIDREGFIVARVIGAIDATTLQQGIDAIR
jgi:thiol-disulfide isomerase/thioredoxin